MGRPEKTWCDCVRGDMESFGLSCEDAQDKDQQRLRITGEPANLGLLEKWALKMVYVCACVRAFVLHFNIVLLLASKYLFCFSCIASRSAVTCR